jgi:hypothetical protein
MIEQVLSELEKLCEAATPGPWRAGRADMVSYDGAGGGPFKNVYCDDPRGGVHHVTGDVLPYTVARGEGDKDECRHNAAFIAAARTALPVLIAEVRRLQTTAGNHFLRKQNDALRAKCESLKAELARLVLATEGNNG